jgi:xanthine dehydrogenase iron-sulfur cluster and FAD-binding subunit A
MRKKGASKQVRNVGTLGGNIANGSPISMRCAARPA